MMTSWFSAPEGHLPLEDTNALALSPSTITTTMMAWMPFLFLS
jgi:hypothetical protein